MDSHDERRPPLDPFRSVLDRAPDRLSVHHGDGPGSSLSATAPAAEADGVVDDVLGWLELFGEFAVTVAETSDDLDRWLGRPADGPGAGWRDEPGGGPGDAGTVPVVVVAADAWRARSVPFPPPAPPDRRVVVVCHHDDHHDGAADAVGGDHGGVGAPDAVQVGPPTVVVEVRRPSEVAGAVCEALAGQSCTVVRVLGGAVRGATAR